VFCTASIVVRGAELGRSGKNLLDPKKEEGAEVGKGSFSLCFLVASNIDSYLGRRESSVMIVLDRSSLVMQL
jgi:hypothetical protein